MTVYKDGNGFVSADESYTLVGAEWHLVLTSVMKDGVWHWNDINGYGNSLNNRIDGNPGINVIWGHGGNDLLYSGGGNDSVYGGDGDDHIYAGSDANDPVIGGNGPILDADYIDGGAGNDEIDGGDGADVMNGGTGDDTFTVQDAGDSVTELHSEGLDLVRSSINYVLTDHVEELELYGDAINGTGNDLDNFIQGNAEHNLLDGKAGADELEGGDGDDTYVVDNALDMIFEEAGGGTELVVASVNWTLGVHVEHVQLAGIATIAVGNGLSNDLFGNQWDNVLDGRNGADRMFGAEGNDTYFVNQATDHVEESEGEGTDTVRSAVDYTLGAHLENLVLTGAAAIDGVGNSEANTLTGNAADNFLDGKAGADELAGGGGNDTYGVDSAIDSISESAGAGTDLVIASVNWVLGANLEHLQLSGLAAKAIGNGLDNTLFGNELNNVLDGRGGADRMFGAGGNDTYHVNQGTDLVEELAREGTDTVRSTIDFALGANLENLLLAGAGAIDGVGNAGANIMTGNAAANVLDGGAGVDRLNGGGGADTLIGGTGSDKLAGGAGPDAYGFDTRLNAASNVDTITGFVAEDDTIHLDDAIFTRLSKVGQPLTAASFKANAAGVAKDANDHIVYDTDSGRLYYDADGNGAGAAVHFATLVGAPAITAADFVVL